MLEWLPRLIYLADRHRPAVSKRLLKYIAQGDLILAVAEKGANSAILDKSLPESQVRRLLKKGEKGGVGSIDEFRILLGQVASWEIDSRKDDLDFSEYLNLMRLVSDYVAGDELVETLEVDLGSDFEEPDLPKWKSGFDPVDLVTDDLYQGIVTVLGKSGHGKTSFMLTWMEELRAAAAASNIWFYEVEIPLKLILWRTRKARERTTFIKGDKIRTGFFTTREILEDVMADPDPERVIMIDGPDAMAAASGDGRRFVLETIYRDLLRIKNKCKLVVVSSQSRRKDDSITMESVAEAWQKIWYSDIVLGIQKLGRAPLGFTRAKLNAVKNRFGPEGREIYFSYDLATLDWDLPREEIQQMRDREEW